MKILNDPQIKNIHCIGIGGIGVSGLAEFLIRKGYRVTGSDMAQNPNVERLMKLGVRVSIGHEAQNVHGAEAIVYTSMIHVDNPEWLEAKKLQLPCVSRGELLAELMDPYHSVVVAGTHGKTTTTGMIIHTMLEAHQNFNYFMGGILRNLDSTVGWSEGKYFVSESDESDASFLYLRPDVGILTNIDADHLETYSGSFEKLQESFREFLNHIPMQGTAVLCFDDPLVQKLIRTTACQKITFGFQKGADYQVYDYRQNGLRSSVKVHCPDLHSPLDIELNVAGKHNVLNALPSIILAKQLNIPQSALLQAMNTFPGVKRRFCCHGEIRAKDGRALLFEDYGHHPNEIKATLEMAKNTWPDRRLILVFQPHRYTRTRDLMAEFAEVLRKADVLVLLEVYAAGENKIEGVDAKMLSKIIQGMGASEPLYVPELRELPTLLEKIMHPNDIILFQGAGNIGPYAQTVAKELYVHE